MRRILPRQDEVAKDLFSSSAPHVVESPIDYLQEK